MSRDRPKEKPRSVPSFSHVANDAAPLPLRVAESSPPETEEYVIHPTLRFAVRNAQLVLADRPDRAGPWWDSGPRAGRVGVILSGTTMETTDELDNNILSLLGRGVRGVIALAREHGYEYTERDEHLLRMSAAGCGEVSAPGDVADDDDDDEAASHDDAVSVYWHLGMSPKTQVWSRRTGRRVLTPSVLDRPRPVRAIVRLRSLVVPFNDGPFFDYEIEAVELQDTEPARDERAAEAAAAASSAAAAAAAAASEMADAAEEEAVAACHRNEQSHEAASEPSDARSAELEAIRREQRSLQARLSALFSDDADI